MGKTSQHIQGDGNVQIEKPKFKAKSQTGNIYQVIGDVGLDAQGVKDLVEAAQTELLKRLKEESADIKSTLLKAVSDGTEERQNVAKSFESIIENKFLKHICDIKDEMAVVGSDIKAIIKKNFDDLRHNGLSEFTSNILDELKGQLDYGKCSGAAALENLLRQTEDERQSAINEITKIYCEINKKWDRKSELAAGRACLRDAEFERAQELFEKASNQADIKADAYFGLALAECKVQTLWGDKKRQFILHDYTINIADNNNYRNAKCFGTADQRADYKAQADEISRTLDYFREFATGKEKRDQYDCDCFVCMKVTAEKGNNTADCEWFEKSDLYKKLTDSGIKTFFSQVDCTEDMKKMSFEYEARIYYALSKAKCMLLVCSDENYLQTPWVKNEYTRFCNLLKQRRQSPESQIIIVFNGKAVNLPGGLRKKAQDINRAGKEYDEQFLQSIADTVKNRIDRAKNYIERYVMICPDCTLKYASNAILCTQCGKKLVDAHTYLNKMYRETSDKYDALQSENDELQSEKEQLQSENDELQSENEKLQKEILELNRRIEECKRKSVQLPIVVDNHESNSVDGREKQTEEAKPEPQRAYEFPTLENYDKNEFEIENGVLKKYTGRRNKVIIIPSGVITVGDEAFYRRTSLTEIIMPDSVTAIGDKAFSYCSGLKNIVIPNGVIKIGREAFRGSTAEIIWGNNPDIAEIGGWAFSGYKGKGIAIPDSVKTIGYMAFNGCKNLESITIPGSVIFIWKSAFYNCTSLTSITIPDSVTSIGDYAFWGCTSLTSIAIPNSVTEIGVSAFWGCANLTSITIPDSVTSIGSYAFCGCTSLTSITIHDGVKTIGANAFYSCKSLTNITIPNSVTEIGERAFGGCEALKTATVPTNIIGYLPKKNLQTVILTGGNSIGDYAFNGCKNLESITIPDSVKTIGEWAFSGCANLTSITIPDSVTEIGVSAFWGCTSLTSITIPNSVTEIGVSAFWGCTSLTSITIPFVGNGRDETHFGYIFKTRFIFSDYSNPNYYVPASLKTVVITGGNSIGDNALNGCKNIKNIAIPDSVKTIGSSAFCGCTSLESIKIPAGVTFIGVGAFQNCERLASVNFGAKAKLTSIGNEVFSGCASLIGITIPDSVASIGDFAFGGCKNLIYIGMHSGVTKIGGYAIHNMPKGVTSIGNYAFSACTSLTGITIPNSVTSIGEWAFKDCANLTGITIPNSVTEIGRYAFKGCDKLKINCEAEKKTVKWDKHWNSGDRPVTWAKAGGKTISGPRR